MTMSQAAPEQYNQNMRYVQEQLVPMLKQLPGIKGAYVLADRQTGKSFTISLWETEAAMNASAQAANQLRGQVAAGTGSAVEGVQGYEVVAQF